MSGKNQYKIVDESAYNDMYRRNILRREDENNLKTFK